ncbi:hypothetical protein ACEPAH_5063 [Sanghuangporus vaninii]
MPRKVNATQYLGSPVKYKQQTLLSLFSSSPSAPARKTDSRRSPEKPRRATQPRTHESDADAEIFESSAPKRSNRKLRRSMNVAEDSDSSDVGKIRFEVQSSSSQSDATGRSSSEAEAEPLSPIRPAKRPRVSNTESEESELENKRVRFRPSRRLIKRDTTSDIRSDSESDAQERSKRRLVKGNRPSRSDEEEDILSGIDEDKIVDSRLRGKPSQKSRFMQNLERLKNKKRGLVTSESEEDSSIENHNLIPGAHPGREGEIGAAELENGEASESEEELDDFIVEDEGDAHTTALPAMFSMNTYQDLVHQFKIVCQYHVHLAVTKPAARPRRAKRLTGDEYFSVPLSIARRKLADIRDSIVSSVWRPDYKKSLMSYPKFELHALDFALPQCDACHLGARISTISGRLGGEPYDRITFETRGAKTESSTDESDDEDHRPLEFNLGRFCARRTKVYHELCHWEYELFSSLLREVEELGNAGRGFVKVAYTGGAELPEDVSDADQVMEWLDQRGIIGYEWQKVKDLISRATNLEADVKRGRQDD